MNINISHSDMDGITCSLLIKHKYKNTSYINISYDKINETLEYYKTYLMDHQCYFWITDLNFKLEELIEVYKLAKAFPSINFIYLDHHDYSDKQLLVLDKINNLPNGTVIVDITKSATKITFEYLKIQNTRIELFVEVVNAFDIWLEHSKYHSLGLDLNNYFWSIKLRQFAYQFSNFNLKNPKFIKKAKSIRESCTKHFKKLEESNLSIVDNNIRIIFTDEYMGMINTMYKEKAIIIGTSYGRISVRLDEKIPDETANKIKNEAVKSVQDSVYFVSGGGHNRAFGLIFNDSVKNNYDLILDLVKCTYKVLEKHL